MSALKVSKTLDKLPETLEPNTIYYVKKGKRVLTYMTDSSGEEAYPVGTSQESLEPFLLMGVSND